MGLCAATKRWLCAGKSLQNSSVFLGSNASVLEAETDIAAPTLTSLQERPSLVLQMADLKYGLVNIRADDEDLDAVDNQFTVSDFCE